MYNHAPRDYVCPICFGVKGIENDQTMIQPPDIVYQDKHVMVFIASFFVGNNSGHLIVVPNKHYENFYDLPDNIGCHIFKIARKMSIVMRKAYNCQGVTTLQNNEPVGGQHALHYHLHLFPRYNNDDIYKHMTNKRETTANQRKPYAEKINRELTSKTK